MFKTKNRFIKFPLHPFLFAVYPILFLYAHNFFQVSPIELIVPLVFSLIATILLYALCTFIYKNAATASIFVSAAVVMFFFYGHLYEGSKWLIRAFGGSQELSAAAIKDRFLLPLILCCIAGLGTFLYFSRKYIPILSKTFTIIGIVLIALNCPILVKDFFKENSHAGIINKRQATPLAMVNDSNNRKPDVYFITLDEFVGFNTLRNYYQYDPSWFFDLLAKKGFHLIPKSRSNYSSTMNCLFSILNMDYIHYNPAFYGKYNVGSLFESMGYRFFNSMPPRTLSDAFYLKMNNAFIMELIHCSMLKSLGPEIQRFDITYIFNNFHKLIHEKSPKFIHIHVMCPHVPFVFDSTGARLLYNDKENWKNKKIYLGQWIFVAKQIQAIIDSIQMKSPAKPIIIIQSDHGIRALPRGNQDPPLISDEKGLAYIGGDSGKPINYFQISCNNVSAFYFPDGNYSDLYDSLTPVNTFRIVFNHLFNANYALLPDESYNGPMVTHETKLKDTIDFFKVTRYARWE